MNTMKLASSSDRGKGELHDIDSHRLARERWRWQEAVVASRITSSAKAAASSLVLKFLNVDRAVAWPSHETWAEATGVSSRTIRRAVAELEAAGFLRVGRRGGGGIGGKGRSCEYRLSLPDSGFQKPTLVGQNCPSRPANESITRTSVVVHPDRTVLQTIEEQLTKSSSYGVQAAKADKTEKTLEIIRVSQLSEANGVLTLAFAGILGVPPGGGRAFLGRLDPDIRARLCRECLSGVPMAVLEAVVNQQQRG